MSHIPDATDNGSFTGERPLSPLDDSRLADNDDHAIERGEPLHRLWCEMWAPCCPDGNPQRVCHPLGFRERNVGELELRVALGGNDGGVCQVIADEREDEVYVRVLVCRHDEDHAAAEPRLDYSDWPVRVWLEQSLGERAVVDVDRDEELPLYKPRYLNNVVQPDHGYHRVHRRHRASRAVER